MSKRKYPSHKTANPETNRKRQTQSKQQTAKTQTTTRRMEIAIYFFGALAAICAIVSCVFGLGGHRDWAIWSGGLSVVLLVITGFCWYQDLVWKSDKEKLANTVIESSATTITPPGMRDLVSELKELNNNDVGFLLPGTSPTPPIMGQIPEGSIAILLGDTVTSNSSFPHVVISQSDEPMLTLGVEANRLWVSANFFSEDGEIVAKIVKNKVYVNKANMTYWMREQTASHLTVFNKQNKIVIDVSYLNPSAVSILGDFYLRNKLPVVIEPHRFVLGNTERSNCFYQENIVDFPVPLDW